MCTPDPYRTARQAVSVAQDTESDSLYHTLMDKASRTILLAAWRTEGNKLQAAKSLGLTYRSFRYHWSRLALDGEVTQNGRE